MSHPARAEGLVNRIMNKQITKAPPRIQRFLLRLQKYYFDLEYTKGKLMKVTDTLNRGALQEKTFEISDKEINYSVHFVVSFLPLSKKSRMILVIETAKDDTLQSLYFILLQVNSISFIIPELQIYMIYRISLKVMMRYIVKIHISYITILCSIY